MNFTEYNSVYEGLIASERENLYDGELLSEPEKCISDIMDRYRKRKMNNKYVCATCDALEEPKIYPPIRPFYEVRDEIEKDDLFEFFKRMPKGGNLHIHTSATLKAEDFINLLGNMDADPNVDGFTIVRTHVSDAKDENDLKTKMYTLFFVSNGSFVDEDYKKLCDLTPDERKELLNYLTMSEASRMNAEKYIWDEFNRFFRRVGNILKVRSIYRAYYRRAFESMIDDNIMHVELRFGPSSLVNYNDNPCQKKRDGAVDKFKDDQIESVKLICAAYEDAKNYAVEKGKTFTLRLIMSASRTKNGSDIKASIREDLDWIHRHWDDFKDGDQRIIVGYDLVSEEDRGYDTNEIADALFNDDGTLTDIPFYFHDGESCWADDTNLISAVALRSRRVGHGINLYHFPKVMEKALADGMAIEVCPISNQLLRYTQDLRTHPIAEYMKRNFKCVICNDDPQIFNYNGLAYDFWEIYYSQLIGLGGIKRLVFNSIECSALSEEIKQKSLEMLTRRWNDFIASLFVKIDKEKSLFNL